MCRYPFGDFAICYIIQDAASRVFAKSSLNLQINLEFLCQGQHSLWEILSYGKFDLQILLNFRKYWVSMQRALLDMHFMILLEKLTHPKLLSINPIRCYMFLTETFHPCNIKPHCPICWISIQIPSLCAYKYINIYKDTHGHYYRV